MTDLPFPVVLASASPRRKELLATLIPNFEVDPAHLNEEEFVEEHPGATATNLALAKARLVSERHPGALVIGADTVVAVYQPHGYVQLGKPIDAADAAHMLRILSGRVHRVYTGLALVRGDKHSSSCEMTRIRFRELAEREIEEYVATGEPLDKAGAYAIQGGAAGFAQWVKNSVTNVIGLPLEMLAASLRDVSWFT